MANQIGRGGALCIEVGIGITGVIITHRRILANILRYPRRLADRVGELVAEDARRLGGLAVVACAARELELLIGLVFFWVQ
jgi:hypothetical protein